MILRRLTKHVQDQNWSAVALDFCIVVVGILLAFQITNWSAARQDNLIYEQARTRVIEEARINFEWTQVLASTASKHEALAKGIIEDFETCTADKDAEGRLIRAMQTLRFYIGIDVRDDAITQLLTSDAFLDNLSPDDRTILSLYARRLDKLAENDVINTRFQLARPVLQDIQVFRRTLNTDPAVSFSGIALDVSYEEACSDATLNSFLFDRLEIANYTTRQANILVNAARGVLIGLGEAVPKKTDQEPTP